MQEDNRMQQSDQTFFSSLGQEHFVVSKTSHEIQSPSRTGMILKIQSLDRMNEKRVSQIFECYQKENDPQLIELPTSPLHYRQSITRFKIQEDESLQRLRNTQKQLKENLLKRSQEDLFKDQKKPENKSQTQIQQALIFLLVAILGIALKLLVWYVQV